MPPIPPNHAELDKHASKFFWGFVALHVVCWTFLPSLIQPNAPLDTVEGFVWGNEMQWGYYKHPPLQAWLLQFVAYIFGNSGFGYFGLSALTIGISFWAIYRTGRLFTTRMNALVATLLCEGIVYFNFLSPEFNPNVLQLMTWSLSAYAFSNAVLRDKLKHWLLLAVFFALGIYAKYSIALLGLGFFIFMITHQDARRFFTTYKPYLALAIFAALIAPHVIWLIQHNFLPFTYALSRSDEAKNVMERLYFPFRFTLTQILDMVPMIALVSMLLNFRQRPPKLAHFRHDLLAYLAFAPLALNFIISLCTGHKALDMWGMPYLSFIPLWLIVNAPLDLSMKNLKPFAIAWGFVFVISLGAFYFSVAMAPSYGFKPLRGHFSGAELSRIMHEKWQSATNTPLTYIVSDAWLGGNIALYSPDVAKRPHVFIDGNALISPWIDMNEVIEKGALVVWRENAPKPVFLNNISPKIEEMDVPWQTVTKMPPLHIYWTIVAPNSAPK
ncbi:MAG: glycosyltransferase family 39 protein [Alphaproteobacteria bacterium]|nr:glycosyltransferase family 39 protein [Alphaproteobacteria bacterium]